MAGKLDRVFDEESKIIDAGSSISLEACSGWRPGLLNIGGVGGVALTIVTYKWTISFGLADIAVRPSAEIKAS